MKVQRKPHPLSIKARKPQKTKGSSSSGFSMVALGFAAVIPLVGIVLATIARRRADEIEDKKLATLALVASIVFFLFQAGLLAWAIVQVTNAVNGLPTVPML